MRRAMVVRLILVTLAVLPRPLAAAQQRAAPRTGANPVRKVITLLQRMQAKVKEEGQQEQKLHDRYVCYCDGNTKKLQESIATAEVRITSLTSEIQTAASKKAQLDQELKQEQSDRTSARNSMKQAEAIRERESAAFREEKAQTESNQAATQDAIKALQAGAAGSFLQTAAAQQLRGLALARRSIGEEERSALLAFLSEDQGSGAANPALGEINGILQQMTDDMAKSLQEATTQDQEQQEQHEDMMAAKEKEVRLLTKSIETKMARFGELSVQVAELQTDLSDTQEALVADQAFLAELAKACGTKKSEWEERVQTRQQEVVALADTIKILNEDDALQLFKKTLPSAGAPSFLQLPANGDDLRKQALGSLRRGRGRGAGRAGGAQLDLIALALRGGHVGLEKVSKMIDTMVMTLKDEQAEDGKKKAYCLKELDTAEDKKKGLEHTVSDEESAIASLKENIAAIKDEMKQLTDGIKALDEAVEEATAMRKSEHTEFQDLVSSDTAAKELLDMAKKRLLQFYNPDLVKEGALAQVSAEDGEEAAPPPPPETFGAYKTKSDESEGVIQMINMLISTLDKELSEAQVQEKHAQQTYEALVKESTVKRQADAKALTQKEGAKAGMERDLETHTDEKGAATKEVASTKKYIMLLHKDCDWLLQYFDARREARAGEVESLRRAKAVLTGADYSFLQLGHSRRLRRRAA